MLALYNATDGYIWRCYGGWLSDEPSNEWYGVRLDDNSPVIQLNLVGNELNREIPPELGNLANLEGLHLNNQLSGCIHAGLGNLPKSVRAVFTVLLIVAIVAVAIFVVFRACAG